MLLLNRVPEVSVAGLHAFRRWPESWHSVIDDVPMDHVRIDFDDSGATYGPPGNHHERRVDKLDINIPESKHGKRYGNARQRGDPLRSARGRIGGNL